MTGIYAIKHLESGKVYIGQAVDIDERYRSHRNALKNNKHRNIYLQRAWNKYGEPAFDFNPLELCDAEDLTVREQWYLDNFLYKYNIATNAEKSALGLKHSPETKMKMSAARLGKKHFGIKSSPETRAKMSAGRLGRKLSPEHIEKLRAANLGRKLSPEAKAKISAANLGRGIGKKLSSETRAKISAAKLGRKISPEHIAKMVAGHLGKKRSPETRAKMSAGMKLSIAIRRLVWTE